MRRKGFAIINLSFCNVGLSFCIMARSYYKLDLHTHSIYSKDGSITEKQYFQILERGILDYIAVTDHDRIDFAVYLEKKIGEKIVVGEEIRTLDGEVIGLYLQKPIPPMRSFAETVALIQEQRGLIYLPHPFCTTRSGVSEEVIHPLLDAIDIVEHFNPRNILPSDNAHALSFAERVKKPKAASSDAHCAEEVGKTYSLIAAKPEKQYLCGILQTATYHTSYTSLFHRF
jgi:predicted metal-dependent phosphoesterase TrpH